MTNPTISCVIPVFNGERYLKAAIDSVLAQTRPPDEVIVVDDGSTDGSAGIASVFGERVRCIPRRENKGPASARNFGVARSTGELVSFLDQDDLWHPEKLERQLSCFVRHPGTDMCVCHVELCWMDEIRDEELMYRNHPRGQRVPGYSTPALLARRSVFDRVGAFDSRLSFADATDFFLRAIDLGLRVTLLPEVLLYHRMHKTNLTRRTDRSEYVRVVRTALDRRRSRATERMERLDP